MAVSKSFIGCRCRRVVSVRRTYGHFYAMLMAGFILAMLSQRFVFVNAELKSEVVTGILLMMAACLMYFRVTGMRLI